MVHISCDALLFDLDGVLIDSTPAVERVWTRWAEARGFNPREVVMRAHGRPSIATVRDYLPEADDQAENAAIERAEIEDLDGVLPLPGALQLLTRLPLGRWTIVTSSTRPLGKVRIAAAGLPQPQFFISSSDVMKGKPHPEPYLLGANRLGFAAERCVVIEDAPAGVCAGKAARMRVIAVGTITGETELRDAGADWVLRNCGDIRIEAVTADGLQLSLANQ